MITTPFSSFSKQSEKKVQKKKEGKVKVKAWIRLHVTPSKSIIAIRGEGEEKRLKREGMRTDLDQCRSINHEMSITPK